MKPGDKVKLIELPTGHLSSKAPLTLGNIYTIVYLEGSNVVTTTDDPNLTASYNRERVQPFKTLNEAIKDHLLDTFTKLGGSKVETAKALDVSLKTVYNMLKKYGIRPSKSVQSTETT